MTVSVRGTTTNQEQGYWQSYVHDTAGTLLVLTRVIGLAYVAKAKQRRYYTQLRQYLLS